MMGGTSEPVWVTATALERLRSELAELTSVSHPVGESDPSRIAELHDLIARAQVSTRPDDGLVEPGMVVTVRYDDEDEVSTFLFGSRELLRLDPTVEWDVFSPDSPLGMAINGRYPGDTVAYTAPSGAAVKLTLVAAVPFD